MARCCGGGALCGCLIVEGAHVQVTGSGTAQDPFTITGDVGLAVTDTTTFDLALTGTGTAASPWTIQVGYASTAKLDDLPDVNAPTPTNAQVLGWDTATSRWTARAPTTAASGSVQHNTSLSGDGSGGSPLAIVHDPIGFTETGASGIKLTRNGINSLCRHFGTTLDRDAANPSPDLNTLSMLDSAPGRMDYWTGAQWLPVTNGRSSNFGTQSLLEMSGSYNQSLTVTTMVRQVSVTTEADGTFEILSNTDIGSFAGVLSAIFQETGAIGYKAIVNGDINRVTGTAYALTDGSPLAFQTVTGTVTANLY
jgi:hypothetical protein